MLKFNCSIITGQERRPWFHFLVCENGCEPLMLRILIVRNYKESPQTNCIGADAASEKPGLAALHSRWHWGVVPFILRGWTGGVENSLDQLLADGVNTNATGPIPEEDSVSKQHYYNVNKLFFSPPAWTWNVSVLVWANAKVTFALLFDFLKSLSLKSISQCKDEKLFLLSLEIFCNRDH